MSDRPNILSLRERIRNVVLGFIDGEADELLRRFFSGEFSQSEIHDVGIDFIYELLCMANLVHKSYRENDLLTKPENHDLQLIAEARRMGVYVPVCGEVVDLIKEWDLQCNKAIDSLDDKCGDELSRIDEDYQKRAELLKEEIYPVIKRLQDKDSKTKDLHITLSAMLDYIRNRGMDTKKFQRERAAWRLRQEREINHNTKYSINDAVKAYGNAIEAERESGGYDSPDSLRVALSKPEYAHELGIAKYMKPRKTSRKDAPQATQEREDTKPGQ